MSDYPEHDKLSQVSEQTQAIGEFLEWLTGEGVQLMIWREDMTDTRRTDGDCPKARDAMKIGKRPCDPTEGDDAGWRSYMFGHCKHWQDAERKAEGDAKQGHCCRCGKGQFYEVTGIKSWTHERRSINELLAAWAGIDLEKIEAEKRQMLASLRSQSEQD
jgi:hypothetical protein